jgi:hypothetical protein
MFPSFKKILHLQSKIGGELIQDIRAVCSSAFTDVLNSKDHMQMRAKGIYQKPEVQTETPKDKTGNVRIT